MGEKGHKCNRCDKTFETEKAFHYHFREHGMRIAEYYQSEFPRYDLYDNKIIKFKSKEFYFNNDFNNKNHLRWWINKQTPEAAKEWCKATLSRRRILKNQVFTPTQVELRSLMIPSGNYLNDLFGDYYAVCEELGYKNKFYQPDTKICQHVLPTDKKIIVDTREQNPLQLEDYDCISKKLDVGDYALEDGEYADNCVIERKSLGDFYSTMSGGNERFRKELDRSVESGQYVVVLVEAMMDKVNNYKYSRPAYRKVKAEPEFVFHRMRDLIYDYPNVQFLFVDGRDESKRMVKQLFGSRGQLKDVDLQLQYDTGNL